MTRSPDKGLPPLDWLRIFEAAARRGGFSAAAREFGLTQAAVSQRIRNLENWLGRDLFLRSARGVTLTYAGEAYLPVVQDALAMLARGTEDMFGTAPRELRIAGLGAHLDALVLPHAGAFLSGVADIRLVTDSVPQRSSFDDHKTWLQLRHGRGRWPGRAAELLASETLQPLAAPATPPDASLIELRGERPGWRAWALATGQPQPPAARLSTDSMEHALSAAAAGAGIVLGSLPLARAHLAAGRLVPLDLPSLKTDLGYWLTWPEEMPGGRQTRRAVTALRDVLRAGVTL